MTAEQARRTIVLYSLATTVALAVLVILSPIVIRSLDIGDAFRVLQIVFPVFAGYLGTAVIFLFQPNPPRLTVVDPQILRYMIYGAFVILSMAHSLFFGLLLLPFLVSFMVSNLAVVDMKGMRVPELANYMTAYRSCMLPVLPSTTRFSCSEPNK